MVLEKTLESPLDCKEIQPVHSEGDQPWDFFEANDDKTETPVLWSLHAKSWLIGKDSDAGRDWGQEEKGTTEDEMAGWRHWLNGRGSELTPGVGDGLGGLACCDSWGCRVRHDWATDLIWSDLLYNVDCFYCTETWISHTYTYNPSLLDFLPAQVANCGHFLISEIQCHCLSHWTHNSCFLVILWECLLFTTSALRGWEQISMFMKR